MKKVISILLVLCVAVTLFAVGSVKVGGAFNFVTGATCKDEDKGYLETKYKGNGFGFDLSGSFDVAKDVAVWADFNMVFASDAKLKYDGDDEWTSVNDQYDTWFKGETGAFKHINLISFSAGAAYKVALNPVDVQLGGGLFIERLLSSIGAKNDTYDVNFKNRLVNIGIALYANCNYKINQNFGIGLSVMPHIGLFNSNNMVRYFGIDDPDNIDDTVKGFKLSYSMPIVLGVSYSF